MKRRILNEDLTLDLKSPSPEPNHRSPKIQVHQVGATDCRDASIFSRAPFDFSASLNKLLPR